MNMFPIRNLITPTARQRLHRLVRPAVLALGPVRRRTPLSRHWGFDRGVPVDRYYIERFLQDRAGDIRGRVLEVKDSTYTNRFGTEVSQRDVLDIDAANPHATIVADLEGMDAPCGGQFDCFILTQTLQMIYDTRRAIRQAHRLLRPGGTLLVTVPALSRLMVPDYWRFTAASCVRLFGDVFGTDQVTVAAHGNVLTAVAFLHGMALEELTRDQLNADDEMFPLVITVRAVKAGDGGAASPTRTPR